MSSDFRAALAGQVLAIDPAKLEGLLARGASPKSAISQRSAPRSDLGSRGVMVLPLLGFLDFRPSWLMELFGGTSILQFSQRFDEAIADPSVNGIVLEVDSPGGTVAGISELSGKVFAARAKKPIVAFISPLAASAAFWVASSAGEVVITPSGEAGSIGVVLIHEEVSGANAKAGITFTVLRSTPEKYEANAVEPLSDSAKAYLQKQLNTIYGRFVEDVARNRGVSTATVLARFGHGRSMLADAAVRAGLADRLGSIEGAITSAGRTPAERRSLANLNRNRRRLAAGLPIPPSIASLRRNMGFPRTPASQPGHRLQRTHAARPLRR
ncbi:MAG TPA: S49 family peptidase [Phycisphaerae bacterium]|nr:S49 family peptidase [Phycisphaerae bacterium]HRY70485.1 S49 family peptidase [Phycisphaerae bacterium]HSA28214.1 S49 family peptidase [Phycisphaerae bacterium]